MSLVGQVGGFECPSGVRTSGRATAGHLSGAPPIGRDDNETAAVGIDLGSRYIKVWASGRQLFDVPAIGGDLARPAPLLRRGRIIDPAGLAALLTQLKRRYHRPVSAGAVVVACRPALATGDDEAVARKVLTEVFDPSRLLFIDTVRAAAIGVAARPGGLLIADVGAEVTEVAVLARGGVAGARRAEIGMNDLILPTETGPVVNAIVDLVRDLRRDPRSRTAAATAIGGGLVMVGGGAAQPQMAARTAAALELPVRPARDPRLAAVRGAGLAALSALRRAAAMTA